MEQCNCKCCQIWIKLGLQQENSALRERIAKLEKVLEAAEAYKGYLPDMDPHFGARKHSEQLRLAWELKKALKESEVASE